MYSLSRAGRESQGARKETYNSPQGHIHVFEGDGKKGNHSIRVHPSSSNACMSLAVTVSSNLYVSRQTSHASQVT